jgi:hypothetical protein
MPRCHTAIGSGPPSWPRFADGIAAPFGRDRSLNGECFHAYVNLAYVKAVLARALAPGGISLIANPGSRNNTKVRPAIKAEGSEPRFLPRDAPDLNPIDPSASLR